MNKSSRNVFLIILLLFSITTHAQRYWITKYNPNMSGVNVFGEVQDSITKEKIDAIIVITELNDLYVESTNTFSYLPGHFGISLLPEGVYLMSFFSIIPLKYVSKSIIIDTRCSGEHKGGYQLEVEINLTNESYFTNPLKIAYYNKKKDIYEYKNFISYPQLEKECSCCNENLFPKISDLSLDSLFNDTIAINFKTSTEKILNINISFESNEDVYSIICDLQDNNKVNYTFKSRNDNNPLVIYGEYEYDTNTSEIKLKIPNVYKIKRISNFHMSILDTNKKYSNIIRRYLSFK